MDEMLEYFSEGEEEKIWMIFQIFDRWVRWIFGRGSRKFVIGFFRRRRKEELGDYSELVDFVIMDYLVVEKMEEVGYS